MFSKIKAGFAKWWSNVKPVVLEKVIPWLYSYEEPLGKIINEKRDELIALLQKEDGRTVARKMIDEVVAYLKRQL